LPEYYNGNQTERLAMKKYRFLFDQKLKSGDEYFTGLRFLAIPKSDIGKNKQDVYFVVDVRRPRPVKRAKRGGK
jgi:hypothetical protein